MDNKFKWNMFVTSFLPLWISIVIADMWALGTQWNKYNQNGFFLKTYFMIKR